MTSVLPGPRELPVVGTLKELNPLDLVTSLEKGADKYGEMYRHVFPDGRKVILVSSHRVVNELSDQTRFDKRIHGSFMEVRKFVGNGLFTARTDEPEWQQAHRILMPAFNKVALHNMFRDMADCADQLMLKWQRMSEDTPIDVADDFTRMTLDTIALASFSYRFNSFYSEKFDPFVDAFQQNLRLSPSRGLLPKFYTTVTDAVFKRNTKVLEKTCDRILADRRENPNPPGREDILDVMLTAKDHVTGQRLSDQNVKNQLMTFLIAGHETTSSLLGFCVYRLISNPQVFTTARKLVDDKLEGRFPTFEDLDELGYIDQIMYETLRMNGPVPVYAVYPLEKTVVGRDDNHDGYEVDVNDSIYILEDKFHRDPTIWDSPDTFDPERFSPENVKKIPSNAWKPFGHGQRSCIGRAFALQEAKMVLILLLQHFDPEFVDPNYHLHRDNSLASKPGDLIVRMKKRPGHPYTGLTGDVDFSGGSATGTDVTHPQHEVEVPKNGHTVKVFVGTTAGICRNLGTRLLTFAQSQGFDTALYDLDDAVENLDPDALNLIVTSSYEGQPPENAFRFVSWLESNEPKNLDNITYAVFGCGNSEWAATYQRIPKLVDDKLAHAGARRLIDHGEGDVHSDYLGPFQDWSDELWEQIDSELDGVNLELDQDSIEESFSIDVATTGRYSELCSSEAIDFTFGVVESNKKISVDDKKFTTNKWEMCIRLPESQRFELGDYAEFLPNNPPTDVDRALTRFNSDPDSVLTFRGTGSPVSDGTTVTIGALLSSYVELSRPAGKRHIKELADACPCPPEKAKLDAYASEHYDDAIIATRKSVLDLLEEFPSISISFEKFIAMLPPMEPRRYSISSSPNRDPHLVKVTYSQIHGDALSGRGPFYGVATNWLRNHPVGSRIKLSIIPGKPEFRGEPDPKKGMLLIGAGTGIAPLLAFVDDRTFLEDGDPTGVAKSYLFYGCHSDSSDYLYKEEFEHSHKRGLLDVFPAFSRTPETIHGNPITYVQDRLWAERELVWTFLNDTDGRIFICGDAGGLSTGVRSTLARIYSSYTDCSDQDAQAWLNNLEHTHHRMATDFFS
ncbi:cytochrome P450 [Corynebacterium kroppenstedtii]|uniref:cytochrome P450 n=1 Tax=Corynebacterium sp. PCR 32 TaxID=3351342 RepID=UPI0030AEDFA6